MSSTILELTRSTHEDIERFQKAVVDELDYQPKTGKEEITLTSRINEYLNRIVEAEKKLLKIYEDKDNSRKEDIESLSGQGPNLYSMFYDRLRDIKDYHRRFPNLEVVPPDFSSMIDDEKVVPSFTGEERYGKCLDLHILHEKYQNLVKEKVIDYFSYLDTFTKFDKVPLSVRLYNKDYPTYLNELFVYLTGFVKRALPLIEWSQYEAELEQIIAELAATEGFKENVEKFFKQSLEFAGKKKNKEPLAAEPLPKTQQSTEQEQASANNNLYCQACKKLFAKQTVFDAHLKGKKHLKATQQTSSKAPAALQNPEKQKKRKNKITNILLLEARIGQLCHDLLDQQVDNTKTQITKKMARTYKEIEEDILREEFGGDVEDDEDEDDDEEKAQIKTTIENYPIGWDGKPIPYWLYKLHGLGVEYKCEICGNASYFGRKAFEKHFQEARHALGMRCLGIPNTKHFQDVTRIQDALQLWQKISSDTTSVQFKADDEEEFEDADGNVMNKKTYEDLKRQGLLEI